jgi:hypothetical protein
MLMSLIVLGAALGSGPQEANASVEAELQKLVGAKKTRVVVAASDGTISAFFADDIKSVTGSQLLLKKRAPIVSSKGDPPKGGIADALGLTKKDDAKEKPAPTREEIAQAVLNQLQQYGQRYGGFGGYWFTMPAPGKPGAAVAGVSGVTTREQELKVEAVLNVESTK